MLEQEIRRLLAVAADDLDAPTVVPAWVRMERAHAVRTRQRQVRTVALLGAASTLAGVVLAVTVHSSSPHSTALRPAVSSTTSATTPSHANSAEPAALVVTVTVTGGTAPALTHTATSTLVEPGGRETVSVVHTRPGQSLTTVVHDSVTSTITTTSTQVETQTAIRNVTTTVTVVHTPPTRTVTVTQTVTQQPNFAAR